MPLNKKNKNRAYVLGRLFAVLEDAQQENIGEQLKVTIRDRYFIPACTMPGSVFPILIKFYIHNHKCKKGMDFYICKIIDMMDMKKNPIPVHLSLEEQGVWILGYYHQKSALCKKII